MLRRIRARCATSMRMRTEPVIGLGRTPPMANSSGSDGGTASAPAMVKLAALAPEPALLPASCAVTRTRAVAVSMLGTVQPYEPEFAMPLAIGVGQLAPPSVHS